VTAVFDAEDVGVVTRFFLHGYISDAIASSLLEDLYHTDIDDPVAGWEIVLNSEGGDMAAGTAIFSELRDYSLRGGGAHEVTTIVRGQAASCASLILQAGDWRVAGPLDYIMLHEPLISLTDQYLSIARDEMRQASAWVKNLTDIFMERATIDRSTFTEHLLGHDWWLDSQEAFSVGFIDEIRGRTIQVPTGWGLQ
jgi:ATP-dependent Clp protease, protease subunit